MAREIWVGLVEVRQLPGTDHQITLSGKGAFTWVTCWANDVTSFELKVSEVFASDGLFVESTDQVMPFSQADDAGIVTDELAEQFEDTCKNENYCIFGTFYSYAKDE